MNIRNKLPTGSQIAFYVEDQTVIRQRIYVGLVVISLLILLVGAWVGRRTEPVNIDNTKIGTAYPVGDGSTQLKLTNSHYNPSKKLLEIDFKAIDSTNGASPFTFTGSEIQFKGKTSRGKAKMETIPTLDNQWTIVISDLDKKFGAVEIEAISKIPKSEGEVTGSDDEDRRPTFGTTQKHVKEDGSMTYSEPTEVALAVVDNQIRSDEKSIKAKNNKLDKTQQGINFENQQIDDLKKNLDHMTTNEADNAADTIGDLRDKISANNELIDQVKKEVSDKEKEVQQLHQKKSDIESGSFDVPEATKTQMIKPKKDE
ncbi:hypothetical protein [Weissella minor]|uniref:hypothetical protein n=1 Tax=Weissella minor TaxID=1620 RepID=UPI003AF29FE9